MPRKNKVTTSGPIGTFPASLDMVYQHAKDPKGRYYLRVRFHVKYLDALNWYKDDFFVGTVDSISTATTRTHYIVLELCQRGAHDSHKVNVTRRRVELRALPGAFVQPFIMHWKGKGDALGYGGVQPPWQVKTARIRVELVKLNNGTCAMRFKRPDVMRQTGEELRAPGDSVHDGGFINPGPKVKAQQELPLEDEDVILEDLADCARQSSVVKDTTPPPKGNGELHNSSTDPTERILERRTNTKGEIVELWTNGKGDKIERFKHC